MLLCLCHFSFSSSQVKNSSLKIMKEVCEKLYIPQRNPKLFPFGEPAQPSAEEVAAKAKVEADAGAAEAVGMLEEPQVSLLFNFYLILVAVGTALTCCHLAPRTSSCL